MAVSIVKKLILVLSISFILIAIGSFLALTTSSSAQSSSIPNQLVLDDKSFLPLILREYPPLCWQGIANGGFEDETDWIFPITEYPADYSTTVAFAGNQSVRAGISDSSFNRFSYSSARQIVTLPTEATAAVLSFWLYPKSSEPANLSLPTNSLNIKKEDAADSGDAQLVLILDSNGVELERLLTIRRNEDVWLPYSFDLSHYAGQTIQIYFGVYNNGLEGITRMYVDEVSLESCTATPICWQGIVNESFEDVTGWVIPINEYPAEYSTDQAKTGSQSMRTGIIEAGDNRFSYSSTNQIVTIPNGATDATLTFWLFPISSEPAYLSLPTDLENLESEDAASWGDVQIVIIYDTAGIELERLVHMRRYDASWLPYSFDLSEYAGETIKIYFGVINNGLYGITSMYVDDVYLRSCAVAP